MCTPYALICNYLQHPQCYCRASLCISKCVMMVPHDVSAQLRYGVQLMVLCIWECSFCGFASTIELIVGVGHTVTLKNCLQTSFIKRLIMRHKWQPLYHRFNLPPHRWEYRGCVGIITSNAVHLCTPIVVIIRFGLDKRVERIHNFSVPYYYHSNAANACTLIIGGLKIYCCKISHNNYGRLHQYYIFTYFLILSVTHFTKSLRSRDCKSP